MTLGAFDEEEPLHHVPLGLTPFIIVEDALRVAWGILCKSGFDIKNSHEDTITHELYKILLNKVFNKNLVNGFDKQAFSKPTREAKICNFDSTKIDKMPDLLVSYLDRPAGIEEAQDWIFIECKPINKTHTVGQKYCDDGLIRFINGDYAWAMTEALMIGYATSDYRILPKLDVALKSEERKKTIPTDVFPTPCTHKGSVETTLCQAVHNSQHPRTFPYKGINGNAPSIMIRHLWLKVEN